MLALYAKSNNIYMYISIFLGGKDFVFLRHVLIKNFMNTTKFGG